MHPTVLAIWEVKDVLKNYIEELQRAFNLHLKVLLNGLQEQNVRHTPFLVISPGTVFVTDAPNLVVENNTRSYYAYSG